MANLAPLQAVLTLNGEQFSGQLAAAQAQAEEFSKKVSSSSQSLQDTINKTSENLSQMAGKLGTIGAGLGVITGGVIAGSVKMASDFQTQMQNIAGNTNMTVDQLNYMKQAVLDLGKQSGASFNDLGQGFMHITNLGYDGADATKILQAAMQSAVATGANVSDVANSLGQVMKDFGMKASQAQDAINVLHTAAAKGNMTLEEMVTAFGQTAGEAANMGMQLPDVAAALSALTRHGVDAAEAGTQLKNMLLKIAAPSSQSYAAIQALSQITGVDLTKDFTQAGLASKGLSGVLADVGKATNGNIGEMMKMATGVDLSKKQIELMTRASNGQLAALQQLDPNIRGLYGMFVLLNNGAQDYKDTLNAMGKAESDNIVGQLSQQKLQTTSQQMSILIRNVQYLGITLGNIFLPMINQLVQKIMPVVDGIGQWVENNKQLVANILLTGAAISGMILAVSGILEVASLVLAVLNPLGLAIMGIVAAVALLTSAWVNDWGNIRETVMPIIDQISNGFKLFVTVLKATLQPSLNDIKQTIDQNKGSFKDLWNAVSDIIGIFLKFKEMQIVTQLEAYAIIFIGLAKAVAFLVNADLNLLVQLDKFKNNLNEGIDRMGAWGDTINDKMIKGVESLLIEIEQSFPKIAKVIEKFLNPTPQEFLDMLNKIKGYLKQNLINQLNDWNNLTNNVSKSINKWLDNTGKDFQNGFNSIKKTVSAKLNEIGTDIPKDLSKAGTNIQSFFTNLPSNIGKWLEGVGNTISNFFTNLFNGDKEKKSINKSVTNLTTNLTTNFDSNKVAMIQKIGDTLVEVFILAMAAVLLYLVTAGPRLVVFLANAISSASGYASSAMDNIKNTLIKSISGAVNSAWNWGSDMIQNLINGINSKIGGLKGSVSNVGNTIKSFLHFSKPDTGPLADADKWMPDMVDLMSSGLRMNLPKLQMAINGALAGTGANSTAYTYQQVNNVSVNSGANSWQQRQDMNRTLQSLSYQSLYM